MKERESCLFLCFCSDSLMHEKNRDKIIQCPPLNRITLGRHESDNNNRMIQLTDVFCVLFIYIWAIFDSIIRDPIKRRALWLDVFNTYSNISYSNDWNGSRRVILFSFNREFISTYLWAIRFFFLSNNKTFKKCLFSSKSISVFFLLRTFSYARIW